MKRAVIAGGGLAGLACGIQLRQLGWEVQIHERRRYPLKKVCGEFLSDAGLRRCDALGLRLNARPLRSARFYYSEDTWFDFDLRPGAWGIRREVLDSALADRFRALGGDLVEGSFYQETATVVATGRPASEPAWLGWKGYGDAETDLGGADLLMVPITGGYCGLARVDNGEISVCLVAKAPKQSIQPWRLLESHPLTRRMAGKLRPHASIAGFSFNESGKGTAIGDASRVWPPVVGDGMNRALAAGMREALRLDRGESRSGELGTRAQFFLSKAAHSLMLSPLALSVAGPLFRRIPALPAAFYRMSRA